MYGAKPHEPLLIERRNLLLGRGGHGVLGGVEDGAAAAAVELVGLQGDLGGDGDPISCLEGDGSREIADQTAVGDIVGTAGHDVTADDYGVLAQLTLTGHQTLDVDGLALVGIHLLGEVAVPQGEIVVGDLDDPLLVKW